MASCAAWRSCRKVDPAVGRRSSMNFETGDMQRTCERKGGVRKFKQARGVIYHAILDAWVIENRRIMKNCLE